MKRIIVAAALFAVMASAAMANIQITEWMYSGYGGEFIEFTNMGSSPVDFTGWSYDDDSNTPGSEILSAFGIVGIGESVIITEDSASVFRTTWNLPASVKVIGGITNNIGRSDTINLYNSLNQLIDKLVYNDQAGKGPRTQYKSCTVPVGDLGLIDASSAWVLASDGDIYGSWKSSKNDIGNPGYYYAAPAVPEPSSLAALGCGIFGLAGIVRRRTK